MGRIPQLDVGSVPQGYDIKGCAVPKAAHLHHRPKFVEGLARPKNPASPRYMSNNDFAGLVSGGWIGTGHLTREELAETVLRLTEKSSRVVLAEAQTRR